MGVIHNGEWLKYPEVLSTRYLESKESYECDSYDSMNCWEDDILPIGYHFRMRRDKKKDEQE
jgi:hypothetical protein